MSLDIPDTRTLTVRVSWFPELHRRTVELPAGASTRARVATNRVQAGGVQWLWVSLIASVVLTILLNVAIRLWPGGTERSAHGVSIYWARRQVSPPASGTTGAVDEPRVQVIAPWKAMLLASVVATVLLNVVLRLA
ncbi:MAG: hypothetical protein V9E94_14875 [Microthrixaceae bacterium]